MKYLNLILTATVLVILLRKQDTQPGQPGGQKPPPQSEEPDWLKQPENRVEQLPVGSTAIFDAIGEVLLTGNGVTKFPLPISVTGCVAAVHTVENVSLVTFTNGHQYYAQADSLAGARR